MRRPEAYLESESPRQAEVDGIVELVGNFCGDGRRVGDNPYEIPLNLGRSKTIDIIELRKTDQWIVIYQKTVDDTKLVRSLFFQKWGSLWEYAGGVGRKTDQGFENLRVMLLLLEKAWEQDRASKMTKGDEQSSH